MPRITMRRCFVGLILFAAMNASAHAEQFPVNEVGRATLNQILAGAAAGRQDRGLSPIVRIVSPLADSAIAGGESTDRVGSPNGTNMVVNVEVVTRDQTPIVARNATEAPPVFGIRHVNDLLLGVNNPDVPGLYVFFDAPLIMPDGTVMPAFSNFASAFNVSGSDDTPGAGRTTWLGWHVLESLPASAQNVTMTVAMVDSRGRVAFDQVHLAVNRAAPSGQALTPSPETFARQANVIDDGQGPEVSMIAPRVPTSIAIGPTDASLNPTNGSLFFIQVSALDRKHHGLAVSENGLTSAGAPLNANIPAGLIFDPSVIPTASHPGGAN